MNLKFLFIVVIILSACSSPKNAEDEKILKEAAQIHLDAIKIEKEIKSKFEELVQKKNQLSVEGRELTDEENQFIAKVENIQASYDYWEENHVEVEGGGHDHDHHGHDHDHDHNHDHGSELEVLPADMLIIQKEFRDTIISIKQRVEKVNFK